jgi:hypothetical protein
MEYLSRTLMGNMDLVATVGSLAQQLGLPVHLLLLIRACRKRLQPVGVLVSVSVLGKRAVTPMLRLLRGKLARRSGAEPTRARTIRIIGVVCSMYFSKKNCVLNYLAGYYGQQAAGQQGTGDVQMQGPP